MGDTYDVEILDGDADLTPSERGAAGWAHVDAARRKTDASSPGIQAQAPGDPQPRSRRVAALVTAVLVGLVALAFWPVAPAPDPPAEADAGPTTPAPEDARLLPWPGRGPLVGDRALVASAVAAWERPSDALGVSGGPGGEVFPLWVGEMLDWRVALLQSIGPDGSLRVAQVVEPATDPPGSGFVLSSQDRLETSRNGPPAAPELLAMSVPFEALRGTSTAMQVLFSPASEPATLSIVDYSRTLQPITLSADGSSKPWAHGRAGEEDDASWLVTDVDRLGPEGTLARVVAVRPYEVLPDPTPLELVPPALAGGRAPVATDVVVGHALLQSLGAEQAQLAVLGSKQTRWGRVVMVRARLDGGEPVQTVGVFNGPAVEWSERVPRPGDASVMAAAVPLPGGGLLAVGVGGPRTATVVLGMDGEFLAQDPWMAVAVVDREAVGSLVRVQAYEADGQLEGRDVVRVPRALRSSPDAA